MNNSQITINLVTNILVMFFTMGINFIITPILVNKLGFSAYGYIGIITNLISFFTVFTYTITSMIGRFYTIELKRDNHQEANEYISTSFYICIIISMILIPIGFIFAKNIDIFINIESALIDDVKLSFLLSFITFILGLFLSIFSSGAYASNRLDISNRIKIISCIIRIVVLMLLFKFVKVKIWFVSLSSSLEMIIAVVLSYYSFRKLIPEVSFSKNNFKIEKVKELILSGSFNSLILMGSTLMSQVLLIVANRHLDSYIVGVYSTILIIPNTLTSIANAISSAYSPSTLKIYATDGNKKLVKFVKQVVENCGYLIGWPISISAAMAIPVFSVWIGSDYSEYRYFIGFIMIHLVSNLAVSQLNVVNQATNKLKLPAIMSILIGVFNYFLAIYMIKELGLGLWGIGISSVITLTLRNTIFTAVYVAIITNQKWYIFYNALFKPQLISIVIYLIGVQIEVKGYIKSVKSFFIVCTILSILYALMYFILLDKENKNKIIKHMKEIVEKNSIDVA